MTTQTGFARPSLTQLITEARASYAARLPDGDLALAQGIVPRLPEMDAAGRNALHAHLDWIANQSHPLFAASAASGGWLDDWGRLFGVARKPPTAAAGPLVLTGVNDTVIPAATEFRRADGVLYAVDAEGAIAAGTVTVAVTALDTGVAGNAAEGVTLDVVTPIAGLDGAATVGAGGLIGGAAVEADGRGGVAEDYRARILARIRRPPHGGAAFDYERWALAVAGVTRAWVYPLEQGAGTVVVRFMMDDTYVDGIPQGAGAPDYTGDLAAVYDHIEGHVDPETGDQEGRPVGAEVFVAAPVADPLAVTIRDLTPDTADVRAAIAAELRDMLRRRAEPGKAIKREWIAEAISIAAGEDSHELDAPAATVAVAAGHIATLGVISYVVTE